ncbi:hypothetical protein VTL71DRAFT_14938 [Oculimacula yallundae]|uniref:Uncharacterized protein n=1 Tax=Oculimacula yallundae TaxID=86028 RepID=A0ABR4CGG1_9HELO
MASNFASEDPPITLAFRDVLQRHQISFHVPPHEFVINTNAGNLMTEKQLREFVDSTLSDLAREFPSIEIPKPGTWKLSTKDIEEDLRKWDPHKLAPDALIVIKPDIENYRPMFTEKAAAHGQPWTWARGMRTFELPCKEAFILDSDSHVLLNLQCRTKFKVVGKAKKAIRETSHKILIPKSHTVSDVVGLFCVEHVSGIYQEPDEKNLRLDQRSGTELGWTNGTTLRIELW